MRAGGHGPPLLLIHGFTGRGSDWAPFLPALRKRQPRSPSISSATAARTRRRSPARHAIERQAADLAEILRRLEVAPAAVLGYSLGARVALRIAIAEPDTVARLVLESPSAGIADPADRAARRAADEQLAQVLDREGIEAFVDRWEDLPLFAPERALGERARARLHAARLRNRPGGLAASLRGAGQGAMEPLHGRLSGVEGADARAGRGAGHGRQEPRRGDRGRDCRCAPGHHGRRRPRPASRGSRPLPAPAPGLPREPGPTPRQRKEIHMRNGTKITWTPVVEYRDIRYEHSGTGIARVTIDRPEVRNAFRPETVAELIDAFRRIRDDASIGCVLLTGAGDKAFCSGGDQRVKGRGGYVGEDGLARLNVLDLQRQIRSLPVPVIALVNGFAIGGGHVLHVVCDLTIASDNAIFGQVGPQVGSFDAGFGIGLLARLVGDKKAKEIWFLCRRYDAAAGARDGPRQRGGAARSAARGEGVAWADEILAMSPTAIRFLKSVVPGRHRRPGRAAGVRRQRDRPLLHDR